MTGSFPGRRSPRPTPPGELRRSLVFFAAALLTVLVLLTLDARHGDSPTVLDPVRRGVATVLAPVQNDVAATRTTFLGYTRAFTDPAGSEAKIRGLEADNVRLAGAAAAANDRAHVSAQLDRLLRTANGAHRHVEATRVAAVGPGQGFEHTLTVGLGSADGVRADSAVLTGAGLVGRVVGVARHSATVLLICDARSAVGVRVGAQAQVAIARGTGDCSAPLQVTELAVGASAKVGEQVTSWGSAGSAPYPPALPIGAISAVGQDRLSLQPAVAFGSLDVVGVVIAR